MLPTRLAACASKRPGDGMRRPAGPSPAVSLNHGERTTPTIVVSMLGPVGSDIQVAGVALVDLLRRVEGDRHGVAHALAVGPLEGRTSPPLRRPGTDRRADPRARPGARSRPSPRASYAKSPTSSAGTPSTPVARRPGSGRRPRPPGSPPRHPSRSPARSGAPRWWPAWSGRAAGRRRWLLAERPPRRSGRRRSSSATRSAITTSDRTRLRRSSRTQVHTALTDASAWP